MGACFAGDGGGEANSGGPNAKLVSYLTSRDLSQWKTSHVEEWFILQGFSAEKEFLGAFQKFSGKDLDRMTEQSLAKIGVVDRVQRKELFSAIKEVQEKRFFNFQEHVVFKKVQKMTKNPRNKSWGYLVETLADSKKIQETYLNPSLITENLEEYFPDGDPEAKTNNYDRLVDTDIYDDSGPDLKKIKKDRLKLPVKLVITELDESKNAKRFLNPVMKKIPRLRKDFGNFSTAIIIGPWWLEWGPTSLCVPRKLFSDMALVSADITTTSLLKNMTIQEIVDKMSQVICYWNTSMHYSTMNTKNKPNTGNCQDFVDDQQDGAFHKYFQKIKRNGRAEMVFDVTKSFKLSFKLSVEKEVKFDSHYELDDFVLKCMEVNEIGFEMDFKEEYQLLKSFDRAFWLRHFKTPSLRQFKGKANLCPFGDPRETKSLITYV